MSVYTKTGDKGKTSMFEADPKKRNRVSKSSLRVNAIGTVDEVNSYLGVANIYTKNKSTKSFIKKIQRNLFIVGSILAKAPLKLDKSEVQKLENRIDKIEDSLPRLRNFILPEGSESAVHFMYARSVCRRAEREVVALSKKEKIDSVILKYLNRLSDYLFVLFRDENRLNKVEVELWIGRKDL